MAQAEAETYSPRLQAAIYICGIFSSGTANLIWVVVPLLLTHMGASPTMIGVALGAYTFLPLLLSIPGGALIDRLGARRVILTFGLALVALMPLYPFITWVPGLIILQMLVGLSASMNWIATQAQVGRRMAGDPTYSGRLAFAVRIGALAGPPAAGAIWDLAGPVGAFFFLSAWTAGVLVGLALLPHSRAPEERGPRTPVRLGDFRPSLASYRDAFALMAVPAILLVVITSVLRQSSQGIQSSFYVVYLESVGYSGTAIGTLLSVALFTGAFGALATGWLAKRFNPFWILVTTVALSIVTVAITPLLAFYVLLMGAIAIRGAVNGVMQPLMLTLVAQAVGRDEQGKAVGLRATANRLAMTTVPVIMGVVVEFVGMHDAFLLLGGVLVVALAGVAVYVKRAPAFNPETPAKSGPPYS